MRARDCGMDVVYEGIRLTPAQIVRAALDEAVQAHVATSSRRRRSWCAAASRYARPCSSSASVRVNAFSAAEDFFVFPEIPAQILFGDRNRYFASLPSFFNQNRYDDLGVFVRGKNRKPSVGIAADSRFSRAGFTPGATRQIHQRSG